jgi:CheY-like chemotaxis protein
LQTSAERGAEMVKQVLSFAGGVEGQRVVLQVKHVVNEVKSMLRHTLPKSIYIETKLAVDVWPMLGDVTQLSQVIMNLCVNARDAMPDGGTLTIAAENILLDENYTRMNLDAKPGPHVLVTVADTGSGIPAEIIDKVFDPFFTTKEQGKGTGLGLSTALGIVRGHGGFINVYSEPGRGTRFSVFLPAAETAQTKQALQQQDDLPVGRGELILVVDDEASIRDITKTTLEAYGYRVQTANDGTEAVAAFAPRAAEINAVLMDMMMPVMDGPATIRVLQKLDPKVRVIATGGLAASAKAAELVGVKCFVEKPYTADKLLITLRQVLDAP